LIGCRRTVPFSGFSGHTCRGIPQASRVTWDRARVRKQRKKPDQRFHLVHGPSARPPFLAERGVRCAGAPPPDAHAR